MKTILKQCVPYTLKGALLLCILFVQACGGGKTSNVSSPKNENPKGEHRDPKEEPIDPKAEDPASGIDLIIKLAAKSENDKKANIEKFRAALQGLKDGTKKIDDKFDSEDHNFLVYVVECLLKMPYLEYVSYLEYAKAQKANFKVIDKYNRSLLEIIVTHHDAKLSNDLLKWLFSNTNIAEVVTHRSWSSTESGALGFLFSKRQSLTLEQVETVTILLENGANEEQDIIGDWLNALQGKSKAYMKCVAELVPLLEKYKNKK
jgi:hypothetical protein